MSDLRSFGCLTARKSTMQRESRKRRFSEVSHPGIRKRKPGSFSRERKRLRLCGEEKGQCHQPIQRLRWGCIKRPFSEFTEDIENPQELSPLSKRKRITTGEEVTITEVPHTPEVSPIPPVDPKPRVRINRIVWDLPSVTEPKASQKNIWIIGSSYIHRGEKAAFDCFGQNFGLNAKVEWFGKGGLRWSGVLPRFSSELSTRGAPDILVVHAGGNDLGLMPAKNLADEMKRGLMQLHKEFPSMRILFSCINERQAWRYGEPRVINGDRRTVNKVMLKAVHQFGGEVVEHPLLRFFKTNLYLHDGVHFSQEGNNIFLSAIHRVLKKMLL